MGAYIFQVYVPDYRAYIIIHCRNLKKTYAVGYYIGSDLHIWSYTISSFDLKCTETHISITKSNLDVLYAVYFDWSLYICFWFLSLDCAQQVRHMPKAQVVYGLPWQWWNKLQNALTVLVCSWHRLNTAILVLPNDMQPRHATQLAAHDGHIHLKLDRYLIIYQYIFHFNGGQESLIDPTVLSVVWL